MADGTDAMPPVAHARIPGLPVALSFALHRSGDKHISHRIATEGLWEPLETEIVRRLLTGSRQQPPLFVDCGANLGWYSVVAAALGAEVVACEPLPANADLLRANVERNELGDLVEVHEVALGDREGTASLRLSTDNQGDHRIDPDALGTTPSSRASVTVPITRLDTVLDGRRPDLVKLDTQGSEVAILRGGRSAWEPRDDAPDAALIIELWPYGLRTTGSHEDELLDLIGPMIDVTHRCFEIREWSQSLVALTRSDLVAMVSTGGFSAEMKGFTNLLLVPGSRIAPLGDLLDPATA